MANLIAARLHRSRLDRNVESKFEGVNDAETLVKPCSGFMRKAGMKSYDFKRLFS